MTTEIKFISDLTVNLYSCNINDESVLHAARVSTRGQLAEEKVIGAEWSARDTGLINYLMREKHMSPFEHGSMTLFVHAPIFVIRQWMRHRTMSYNEESGRYSVLEPVFYVPPVDRPLVQHGKVGAYTFTQGSPQQHEDVIGYMKLSYEESYSCYEHMLKLECAPEMARAVLPVATYTSMYVTANTRNWLQFLALRMDAHAQWEINKCAQEVYAILKSYAPKTVEVWEMHNSNLNSV